MLATPQAVRAHVTGITWIENRPVYAQPAATNALAIDAKKKSTAAAGKSRSLGTPARLRTATRAPARIGSADKSNRGGSFTVSTIITL